jgi:hypothetical protein
LDTVKTGTAAPDSHSAQGEAHHVESLPPLAVPVLVALCTIKLLLHLFTSVRHCGYFRDELYYLDMARHLDWGYVDAAPLIAVYTKVAMLMGGSLAALRILPALAGAALIALTILIAQGGVGMRPGQRFGFSAIEKRDVWSTRRLSSSGYWVFSHPEICSGARGARGHLPRNRFRLAAS